MKIIKLSALIVVCFLFAGSFTSELSAKHHSKRTKVVKVYKKSRSRSSSLSFNLGLGLAPQYTEYAYAAPEPMMVSRQTTYMNPVPVVQEYNYYSPAPVYMQEPAPVYMQQTYLQPAATTTYTTRQAYYPSSSFVTTRSYY